MSENNSDTAETEYNEMNPFANSDQRFVPMPKWNDRMELSRSNGVFLLDLTDTSYFVTVYDFLSMAGFYTGESQTIMSPYEEERIDYDQQEDYEKLEEVEDLINEAMSIIKEIENNND